MSDNDTDAGAVELVERLSRFWEMLFQADALALKPTKPNEVQTTLITTGESRQLRTALIEAIARLTNPAEPSEAMIEAGIARCKEFGLNVDDGKNEWLADVYRTMEAAR